MRSEDFWFLARLSGGAWPPPPPVALRKECDRGKTKSEILLPRQGRLHHFGEYANLLKFDVSLNGGVWNFRKTLSRNGIKPDEKPPEMFPGYVPRGGRTLGNPHGVLTRRRISASSFRPRAGLPRFWRTAKRASAWRSAMTCVTKLSNSLCTLVPVDRAAPSNALCRESSQR